MTLPQSYKGTNVRFKKLAARAIPLVVGTLDTLVPSLAARLAADLFCTPPRPVLSERAGAFIASGRPLDVYLEGLRLGAWGWGPEDRPTVVLFHGWGGRSSQMSSFLQPLLERGYRVVALDGPAHGGSEGRRAALPLFASALRALQARIGPFDGLIAHSMGGSSSALAMHAGLEVRRAVFIGSPQNPFGYAAMFARRMGMRPATLARMQAVLEERFDIVWSELSVAHVGPSMRTPLLVVHDEEDAEVPFKSGEAIVAAWPGARLLATRGLGHRRVLRDPSVVRAVAAFVGEESGPARG
jgi:pimeloyl-ACP methyl ester carboxylesterase